MSRKRKGDQDLIRNIGYFIIFAIGAIVAAVVITKIIEWLAPMFEIAACIRTSGLGEGVKCFACKTFKVLCS